MTALDDATPPPPATGPRSAPAWTYLLALTSWAALVVVFGLAAHAARRAQPDGPDQRVHDWAIRQRDHFPNLTLAAKALTWLGNEPVATILVVLVAVALVELRRRRVPRIARGEAAFWLGLNVSSYFLALSLKLGFQRQRPPEEFWLVLAGSYSFPSIHSSFSATFFGALAALILREDAPLARRRRLALAALCLLIAAGVAASRVWLGVHYATDVLGGSALGFGCVLTAWAVRLRWARPKHQAAHPSP